MKTCTFLASPLPGRFRRKRNRDHRIHITHTACKRCFHFHFFEQFHSIDILLNYLHQSIIMKIFLAIVAFVTIVTAFPAPRNGNETEAKSFTYTAKKVDANCQPGLDYCYQQIVEDLGTYPVCSRHLTHFPFFLLKHITNPWIDQVYPGCVHYTDSTL
jgi:hypothetical protein